MASASQIDEKSPPPVEHALEEFRPEENEYETQLFRFTPKSLIDSLFNGFFETLEEKLKKVKEITLEKYGGAFSEEEIEQIFAELQTEMTEVMHFRFALLEKYALKYVFTIPPYICLPEDEIKMDPRLDTVKKADLNAEIQELERKADKIRFMKEILLEELELIEVARSIQKRAVERIQAALDLKQDLGDQRYEQEAHLKMLLALTNDTNDNVDTEPEDMEE